MNQNEPPLPGPLLHPMEERVKTHGSCQFSTCVNTNARWERGNLRGRHCFLGWNGFAIRCDFLATCRHCALLSAVSRASAGSPVVGLAPEAFFRRLPKPTKCIKN